MSVDDSDESLEETEEFSSLLSIEGTVEEPLLLEPVEEEEEVLKEESSLLLELRLLSLPKSAKSNNCKGGRAASTPMYTKAQCRKAPAALQWTAMRLW
jgi:hypothetical protein